MFATVIQSSEIATDLEDLTTEVGTRRIYRTIAREIIPPLERQIERRLTKYEPPPPDRPLRFKSAKQRRKVMALLHEAAIVAGRPGDIRYRRTHALVEAWYVELVQDGTTIIAYAQNDADMAQFVYGPDQQPFLDKWPDAGEVIQDIGVQSDERLGELWAELVEGH